MLHQKSLRALFCTPVQIFEFRGIVELRCTLIVPHQIFFSLLDFRLGVLCTKNWRMRMDI